MTDYASLISKYRVAKKRILLLDYDGTLAGFKRDPSLSKPSAKLLRLLKKLGSDPKNTVVVISGRDQPTLETWLGHLPITLVAEHGFAVKQPNKGWQQLKSTVRNWMPTIKTAMDETAAGIAGSSVEQKSASVVWHYRAAKNQTTAELAALELINKLASDAKRYHLSVARGSKVVEVKPIGINKGAAANKLLAGQDWDFILAAGDDTTDEDLFAAMPKHAFTIKVREGQTKAKNRLPSHKELKDLLTVLAGSA